MYGLLRKKEGTVKPSMEMQFSLNNKHQEDRERFTHTLSSSLPSLGSSTVYDASWGTVVGWGSHRQKHLQLSHGKKQKTNAQRPVARQQQGLRNLYPFVYP